MRNIYFAFNILDLSCFLLGFSKLLPCNPTDKRCFNAGDECCLTFKRCFCCNSDLTLAIMGRFDIDVFVDAYVVVFLQNSSFLQIIFR